MKKIRFRSALVLPILVAVLIGTALGYSYHTVYPTAPKRAVKTYQTPVSRNFLIMGVDERWRDTGRSDTLLLVKVDNKKKQIQGISIPRDSLVDIPGHGYTKINHSFGYGGPELVKKAVEDALSVKIDNYAVVNFADFEKLIDRFGGIKIKVDKNLHYIDKAGDLYIDIPAGTQTLDGKTALGFVRFRHDALGDIGRMKRQQQLCMALIKKLTDPRMAVSSLSTLEKTDIRANDILSLWPIIKNRSQYKISFQTAAGKPLVTTSGDYYLLEANADRLTGKQGYAMLTKASTTASSKKDSSTKINDSEQQSVDSGTAAPQLIGPPVTDQTDINVEINQLPSDDANVPPDSPTDGSSDNEISIISG